MTAHPLALATLTLIAGAKLVLHLLAVHQYGYFRDELYYLASTEHLAWGYVDHPPLSIALLAAIRAVLGDSLLAIRIVPALVGSATVFLTGNLAQRLGGGAFAQALAALAALFAPQFLGTNHFYSMNTFDLFFWAVAIWFLLEALDKGTSRAWISLGVTLGLALLNKISALWLCGGIALALLLTPYRRVLLRPWPAVAALVAALLFLPHILWQVREGWPTLEFMRNATTIKMSESSPLDFLLEQVLTMNPGSAPIWIAGALFGILGFHGPRGRVLGWIYVAVLVLLIAAGRSRASYLAPAYPMLFALGACSVERAASRARMGWLRTATAALVILGGLPLIPPRSSSPSRGDVCPLSGGSRHGAANGGAARSGHPPATLCRHVRLGGDGGARRAGLRPAHARGTGPLEGLWPELRGGGRDRRARAKARPASRDQRTQQLLALGKGRSRHELERADHHRRRSRVQCSVLRGSGGCGADPLAMVDAVRARPGRVDRERPTAEPERCVAAAPQVHLICRAADLRRIVKRPRGSATGPFAFGSLS